MPERWTIYVCDECGRVQGFGGRCRNAFAHEPHERVMLREVEAMPVIDVDDAAFELYAAGPWGTFDRFLDNGLRVSTDAHSMDTYRAMVRETLQVAPPRKQLSSEEDR